jgi:transposase
MQLDNNSCIIIDNASIYKNLTLNTTPNICYNVPYSPENNPIELCFGVIKNYFR